MSESNKKVFEVEVDGAKVKLACLRPTHQVRQQSQLVYSRVFRAAVRPEDGGKGAIVREALESVLREQGLWNDAKEAELKRLSKKLADAEKRLAKGGMKMSEARALAVQMRRDRNAVRDLLAGRNSLDANTAEAQAENARFNYLVAACTVHADGVKAGSAYWKDEEAYVNCPKEQSEAADQAARLMAELVYGLEDGFERKLPENRFLLKYKQCDDKLRLVDKDGHLVDADGRRVNEFFQYVDANGDPVDADGTPLTADGEYKVDFEPFTDDDGLPILEAAGA